MRTANKTRETSIYNLSKVCEQFGLKRDAYYKYQKRYQKKEYQKSQVLELVKERRKELPREGCRKLHNALREQFIERNIKVGRDSCLY